MNINYVWVNGACLPKAIFVCIFTVHFSSALDACSAKGHTLNSATLEVKRSWNSFISNVIENIKENDLEFF